MSAPWVMLLERPGWPAGFDLVLDGVESARTALGALSGPRGVRDRTGRVAAAASIRAARASAGLEGVPLALDPDAGTVTDPILAGAIRVAAELASLTGTWRRSPLQVLARLHTLAAADLLPPDRLGRPVPDGPSDVAARLAGVAELVVHAAWPAPVLVALVHGEIATLAPFGVADGVIARAAARLTMITTGLDPSGLCLPEVALLQSAPSYRAGLRAYGAGGPEGLDDWVVQSCRALVRGAAEARSLAAASG